MAGGVSYKFATQYHFIIAWRPTVWIMEWGARQTSRKPRRAPVWLHIGAESDINENGARSGVTAYGSIIRTPIRPRSVFLRRCIYIYIYLLYHVTKDNRDAITQRYGCLWYAVTNYEIWGATKAALTESTDETNPVKPTFFQSDNI